MKKGLKYALCISLIAFTLTGCGKIPQLKDGKELVFEMKGLNMTTEDFYQKLKDTYGTNTLINSIDNLLLNKVYETDKAMKTKIEAQIKTMKDQFGSDFENAINYYYGVNNEKQLYDFIETAFKRELAAKDYARTLVSDKDIEKYYNEKAIGDIKASHILIKPEASDKMTEDEKKAAEKKALKTAEEVIEKLKKGEKFADLAKKYSKDASASDGGNLGFFNRGDMVKEFEDAAVELKVNEYTKKPVKTQFGYHIIWKTEQKKKPALKEIKEEIRNTLIDDLIKNTENISAYSMEWLRDKNDLKIYDAELKIKYDHFMNQQKSNKTDKQ